jgi:hypothetical protein
VLTNMLIQSILPSSGPVKKADGGGLHICVMPNGTIHWRLAYRFEGKQKTLRGGAFPEMSIDRARVWREEMKAVLASGKGPSDVRRHQKYEQQAERTTFQQLAEEWMAVKRPGWTPRYAGVIERRLPADIFPTLGKMSVRAIGAACSGASHSANRTASASNCSSARNRMAPPAQLKRMTTARGNSGAKIDPDDSLLQYWNCEATSISAAICGFR